MALSWSSSVRLVTALSFAPLLVVVDGRRSHGLPFRIQKRARNTAYTCSSSSPRTCLRCSCALVKGRRGSNPLSDKRGPTITSFEWHQQFEHASGRSSLQTIRSISKAPSTFVQARPASQPTTSGGPLCRFVCVLTRCPPRPSFMSCCTCCSMRMRLCSEMTMMRATGLSELTSMRSWCKWAKALAAGGLEGVGGVGVEVLPRPSSDDLGGSRARAQARKVALQAKAATATTISRRKRASTNTLTLRPIGEKNFRLTRKDALPLPSRETILVMRATTCQATRR
mmetsp:Transcript_5176/g.15793  ORF Transcript_5176/g.15793 Transcript_5176/m.15793 type:complete len:283 (+) Transcript_5176:911-1759(+)